MVHLHCHWIEQLNSVDINKLDTGIIFHLISSFNAIIHIEHSAIKFPILYYSAMEFPI